MVGGVAGEHVGQTGLDAHADQRQEPALAPAVRRGELLLAEHPTRQLVRPLRVRRRDVHRHVDVVATRVERGGEDRRVEPRVARVHDDVGARLAGELGDRERVGRVERARRELTLVETLDRAAGSSHFEVGHHDLLEDVRGVCRTRDGPAHAARADQENPHRDTVRQAARAAAGRTGRSTRTASGRSNGDAGGVDCPARVLDRAQGETDR